MTWDVTCARWAEMIRRVTPPMILPVIPSGTTTEPEVIRIPPPDPVPLAPVGPS